jgi:hypothetical protein
VCLGAALLSGCITFKKQVSYKDEYDAVRVDQMVANEVSPRVLQRTIVRLNARRETRPGLPTTNQWVTLLTNVTVTTLTNQTVTAVTNRSRTLATNQLAQLAPASQEPSAAAPAGAETNQIVLANTPPSPSTNQSVTTAFNLTLSKAHNQTVTTANAQTLLSRQVTFTTNNLSMTTAENQAISVETNEVVTTVTNFTITALTNQAVVYTNQWLRDYYLFTELTPPPDFTLAGGESLVLLVDGVRHGFSPANSQTAFVSQKGFTSTLYKVPPELLVNIANAKEVKVRLKGVNSVIERHMSRGSRNNFKKFLLKYFVPESSNSHFDGAPTSSRLWTPDDRTRHIADARLKPTASRRSVNWRIPNENCWPESPPDPAAHPARAESSSLSPESGM